MVEGQISFVGGEGSFVEDVVDGLVVDTSFSDFLLFERDVDRFLVEAEVDREDRGDRETSAPAVSDKESNVDGHLGESSGSRGMIAHQQPHV